MEIEGEKKFRKFGYFRREHRKIVEKNSWKF